MARESTPRSGSGRASLLGALAAAGAGELLVRLGSGYNRDGALRPWQVRRVACEDRGGFHRQARRITRPSLARAPTPGPAQRRQTSRVPLAARPQTPPNYASASQPPTDAKPSLRASTGSDPDRSAGEECPRSRSIPPGRDHHVYHLAALINRPVQVYLTASDLDVGLLDEPPVPGGVPGRSGSANDLPREPVPRRSRRGRSPRTDHPISVRQRKLTTQQRP